MLIEPAGALDYAAEGAMLDLPIAQRLPQRGYRTEHWVPVLLTAARAQATN